MVDIVNDSPHYQNFLRWLIVNDFHDSSGMRFAITISESPLSWQSVIGDELTECLNRTDERCGGKWTWFDQERTASVAELGFSSLKASESCWADDCPCRDDEFLVASDGWRYRLLRQIVRAGNAVVIEEKAQRLTCDVPRVFHVKLHERPDEHEETDSSFQLVVNMERARREDVVLMIATSALMWASALAY